MTGRELEVLTLLGRGLSNPEIAAELGISRETVKTHVSRILMKLGLRDRVHAVVFAHRHGLLSGTDRGPERSLGRPLRPRLRPDAD